MKYKVGDKVKIKTWKQLEEEFGIHPNCENWINCPHLFTKEMDVENNSPEVNRELTIEKQMSIEAVEASKIEPNILNEGNGDYYIMVGFDGRYTDAVIKYKI